MDERAALALVADAVAGAGDDAAVVDETVITTDMLHESTDFPAGTTRYTAGWRSVAASLSDVAAMGAAPTAAVAVYAAPVFERDDLRAFLDGAQAVCAAVDASYVGGDLDSHEEFTVATTALGETADPVGRDGARPGDRVGVTGRLGRSAAAVRLFETDPDRANDLFRFRPRTDAGVALAPHASAMMDVSDGLAHSLHAIADAGDVGVAVDWDAVPVADAVAAVAGETAEYRDLALSYGEDFELLCTVPPDAIEAARADCPVRLADIGTVTRSGVELDGEPLPDRGYAHGE
ncbi:MAG: thiamine-phosphate kinase [Halobacteriaceae archaeon]